MPDDRDGDGNYPIVFYIAAKTKRVAEGAAMNLLEAKRQKDPYFKGNKSSRTSITHIEKLGTVYQT
jgi:hypothetical protein